MTEDVDPHHLLRSLQDERQLVLLPRLRRLEDALKEILEIAAEPNAPTKLRRLVQIRGIAEAALLL